MSKTVRLQITINVMAHVGNDLSDAVPTRDPDAVQVTRLVRVAHCGAGVLSAPDVAGMHAMSVLSNAAPVLAERINYDLKQKHL